MSLLVVVPLVLAGQWHLRGHNNVQNREQVTDNQPNWNSTKGEANPRKILLPPYQKEVYTLLQEAYLMPPEGYRDSKYIIQN